MAGDANRAMGWCRLGILATRERVRMFWHRYFGFGDDGFWEHFGGNMDVADSANLRSRLYVLEQKWEQYRAFTIYLLFSMAKSYANVTFQAIEYLALR